MSTVHSAEPSTPGSSKACEPSKRSPRLEQLRVVAALNSSLHDLLRIIEHVVSERVLEQI